MIRRTAATVAIAVSLVAGVSGCEFIAPQASLIKYSPSDGVDQSVGDIDVRNAIVLSDDGDQGSLLASVINQSHKAILVSFQYQQTDGTKQTSQIYAQPDAVTDIGYGDGSQVPLTNIDSPVGSLIPVYVQYGKRAGKGMMVPVLDGQQSQFATLVPTVTPTPTDSPTKDATPTPSATPTAG